MLLTEDYSDYQKHMPLKNKLPISNALIFHADCVNMMTQTIVNN